MEFWWLEKTECARNVHFSVRAPPVLYNIIALLRVRKCKSTLGPENGPLGLYQAQWLHLLKSSASVRGS